ncbi:solute carrier family 22 member 7-like [Argonauta hians]
MIDVDSLFMDLKEKGFYQVSHYIVAGLSLIPIALSLLKLVFVGAIPESTCLPLNETQLQEYGYLSNESHKVVYGSCQIDIYSRNNSYHNHSLACINGYAYDREKDASFVSEWDLVCDKAGLAELTQTLYALGGMFGSLVMPYFSDTRGRKPILFLGSIFVLIVGVGSSFSPNYVVYIVLRALEGVFIQGVSVSCFTMMLELFPVSSKTLMCGLSGVMWGCSVTPIGLITYLLRHYSWRINNTVFSSAIGIIIFQIWYLDESLRWLVTNGYVERSKKIIQRAARMNSVDFKTVWQKNMESTLIPLVSDSSRQGTPSEMDLAQQAKVKEEGFHTIFQDPLARRLTFFIFIIGIMNSLTYFGIYLTSSSLAGNPYLNFFLVSVTEIAANSLMAALLFKLQRRTTMALFQCLSGTSLLLAVIVNNIGDGSKVYSVLNTVLSMMGMFGISASYCVIWLYTPEVYPTNLRNIGLGFLTCSGCFASMISPFSRVLLKYIPWLPGTIFSVGSISSTIFLLFMPETQKLQMPSTMSDVRKQLELQKRSKKLKRRKGLATAEDEEDQTTTFHINN